MTKNRKTESFKLNPQLAAVLIKPFSDGARLQVKRLLSAQQYLKHDPIKGVGECYHEASNLFEDLATIVQYLNLYGIKNQKDQLFKDIRDHIRHDIREEFDSDERRKKERAERLKLNPKLQSQVSFEIGLITVGEVKVKLSDITSYLNIADATISLLFNGWRQENINEGAV